jgi:antitoxin component YwqK of YwqJK toxin-antitoxin module
MKTLLGLLLVMGMVGCGGGKAVDAPKWVKKRDGLTYEGDSETPFTGVAVYKHENGQKRGEGTFKDGKPEGLATTWYENGQKRSEVTWKDGKVEGLVTHWHGNGQKAAEATFKDGKQEGPTTDWHENGQKAAEAMFKDGKIVSKTKWDEEGNEIKK